MFRELDPLLHSQLRLAIISLLANLEEAEFVYLKEKTKATAGNLSLQLDKLQKADYISIRKGFKNKYPVTVCSITATGRKALGDYIQAIKTYIDLR